MPLLSLEFCDGGSLDAKLKTWTPSPPEAAALAETLARAMHHAHLRGVVHHDLKPANVVLTSNGTPKITDFGLAKKLDSGSDISRSGANMGTPCYMAPEQAEGKIRAIGPAADVYALCAVLYELLAGRLPLPGRDRLRHDPPGDRRRAAAAIGSPAGRAARPGDDLPEVPPEAAQATLRHC